MAHHNSGAQCFADNEIESVFTGENCPRLKYVSNVTPTASTHPRIMHAHDDCVELILIYEGSSEFLIHDKKHSVQAGDVLIYNSGVVHDEVSGPDLEVGLYCAAVNGLKMPGLRHDALIADDKGYVFHSEEMFEDLLTLFKMMYNALENKSYRANEYCNGLMNAMLIKIISITEQESENENKGDASALGLKIKAYIDEHFHEPITLNSISSALNISTYYLAHVFKQMSGYSPIQYILRRRIGEAQTLLARTDLSIAEIAERVGYETQSYFNYQFTKHVGMPPRRYRQNYVKPVGPVAGKMVKIGTESDIKG